MTTTEQPNTSPEAIPNTEGQSAENPQTLLGSEPTEETQPTEESAEETTTEQAVEELEQTEPESEVPENYEFTVPEGLPEGHQFDEAVMAEFGEVARELKLSQESAQKVVDRLAPKLVERALAQHEQQIEAWGKEARKHPDLVGGDGFEANLKAANRALETFGSQALKDMLKQGLGNHPEIVAALARVGNALKPDGFVAGGPAGRKPVNPNDLSAVARVMYPDGPKD